MNAAYGSRARRGGADYPAGPEENVATPGGHDRHPIFLPLTDAPPLAAAVRPACAGAARARRTIVAGMSRPGYGLQGEARDISATSAAPRKRCPAAVPCRPEPCQQHLFRYNRTHGTAGIVRSKARSGQ